MLSTARMARVASAAATDMAGGTQRLAAQTTAKVVMAAPAAGLWP
jgi:hypothetical protein